MRERERGTAIVEFALAFPLFFLLVVGTLDFGRAVYIRNVLANAARDGARVASVEPTNSDCIRRTAIQRGSIANLRQQDVAISFPASAALDQPVRVTVRTTYRPLTTFLAGAIGVSSIPLQGEATMRIRNLTPTGLPCP